MRMPDAILSLLPMGVRNHLIFSQAAEANWNALRACYPTENAALDAATECRPLILPYGAESLAAGFYELGEATDRSDKIAGSYQVLQNKLSSDDEVLDIVTKNPGVLGCAPSQLEKASAEDIRRGAQIAGGVNSFFSGARRWAESTSWWDEGVGQKTARERSDDADLVLPGVQIDGRSYLYDFFGDYMEVEQLLLTEDGEPVAVWNPERQEVEEVEFDIEDDDADEEK